MDKELLKKAFEAGETYCGNIEFGEYAETFNDWYENNVVKNNGVLDDVIKCEYCGDVGRVEPTLQYPDGIKCYKCP